MVSGNWALLKNTYRNTWSVLCITLCLFSHAQASAVQCRVFGWWRRAVAAGVTGYGCWCLQRRWWPVYWGVACELRSQAADFTGTVFFGECFGGEKTCVTCCAGLCGWLKWQWHSNKLAMMGVCALKIDGVNDGLSSLDIPYIKTTCIRRFLILFC